MNIPIKTNKDKFHKEVLDIIRALPPLNVFTDRELELLSEIMKQYQEYSDIDKDQRKHLIFSKENRVKMQEKLKISKGNMNTYLVKMRKHKLLSKDNDLAKILDIPFEDFDIHIKFIMNGK